jgi:16S rRNA (guanine966-N2)-methyltransferase
MSLKLIGGIWKGRLLKTPKGDKTRPTQGMLRAAVFNICQNEIEETRFLDLFAGSGAMGLEALSRGAAHATFVEKDKEAARCITENIHRLQAEEKTTLLISNVAKALASLEKKGARFNIIYIDPPYDTGVESHLPAILPILAPRAWIFLEERALGNKTAPRHTALSHKDSRRFGEALLHQYHFTA